MLSQNFKTAEELKISPELYDGLHQVLRMFERGGLIHVSINNMKPGGFNMAHEFATSKCGTAGCILGWARFLNRRIQINRELDKNSPLQQLYSAYNSNNVRTLDLHKITVEQASHALRTYLVTGTPDWGT